MTTYHNYVYYNSSIYCDDDSPLSGIEAPTPWSEKLDQADRVCVGIAGEVLSLRMEIAYDSLHDCQLGLQNDLSPEDPHT